MKATNEKKEFRHLNENELKDVAGGRYKGSFDCIEGFIYPRCRTYDEKCNCITYLCKDGREVSNPSDCH